ncbi:YadA-like family protein [Nitratireductor luteus]|uniref:YadA-like family protein n=1 Tax=Nitratireductor luteus TaxID=2976980 RepID=UPI00223ECEF3|nr:YadA-like family protein [Nitratireductor luteus]
MTVGIERESRRGFVGNWVSGGGDSRWQRRRLMAVLRLAHRALGLSRKRLGLGALGFGTVSRALLAAAGIIAPQAASAQVAIGNGTLANPACGLTTSAVAMATALGCGATASGVNGSVAIGYDADATGFYGIALGLNSRATGDGGMALGVNTVASHINAVALGVNASATSAGASALGTAATASGSNSTAVGVASTASGMFSFAGGRLAAASQQNAVAIGFQSTASAINSIYLGARTAAGTGALAQSAIAIGTDVTASQADTIAMGRATQATGLAATAIGNTARATGNSALALGAQAVAVGDSTVAVGQGAGSGSTTGNASSVAVGIAAGTLVSGGQNSAVGGGIASVLRGAGSGVSGARNVAMGTGDGSVTYDGTLAASAGNLVTGNDNIAIGTNAGIGIASNTTTSIGYNAMASADNAIAMGNAAVADSVDAVAIGTGATATGGKAVSIGFGNIANGDGAVAIGDPNTATGAGAIAQGKDNTATGDGSVAMGNTNMVGGGGQAVSTPGTAAQGAVGIGYQNTVIGQGSVAIGNTSSALAAGAVAFGDTAIANNAGDVALGSGSVTGVAVGTPSAVIDGTTYNFAGTTPTSTVSVGALGAERTITNVAAGRISGTSTDAINGSQLYATNQAVDSLATTVNNINDGAGIKYFHANSALPDSQALGTDSVAIGPNAVANNAGDVAIGSGAVSGATTVVSSAVIGGTTYNFAGGTPASAFSVGALGAERQIQNVAAGRLSNSSTDAVNGSQLFATNQQVTINTTDIANLDGRVTTVEGDVTNLDGRVTTAEGNITNLGNTINNIAGDTSAAYTDANGDGIRYVRTNDRTLPVADSSAQGIASTAVGYQATAVADNSLALGRDSQASIAGGVALGSGSVADRALAPVTGQIPVGAAIIEYNTTDKTLLGAVSVGTDTSYRQITNVADGTNAQDAVTIRQLQGAIASVATTPSMYFHANSTAGDSLAVGAESIAVGPTTVVNGDNGIGIGNGAIVDQIAPGGTAIGQNAHVMLADGIALGTSSRSAGIQSVAIGAGAQSDHANSVALGAGSVTQATVATSGTTINGQTYDFAGAAPVGTVSVGDAGAERTITNVAAGRISADSTDAINGSQLYATNQALNDLSVEIGDVGTIANNAVAYETVTNPDGSVTRTNNVILEGGDPSAPVVISNVGAGVANTDAVNVAQLNEARSFAVETANDYTDQVAATTLGQANDYTDQKFSELNQAYGDIRAEARQAAAIGLAAASLRYDDRPGKLSVAMGGGYWRREAALAFGAGYTSENGRVRANLSGTTTDGHWGVGAGLSFTLN